MFPSELPYPLAEVRTNVVGHLCRIGDSLCFAPLAIDNGRFQHHLRQPTRGLHGVVAALHLTI